MMMAAPVQAVGGFGDVPENSYYTAPVQWMADAGISSGTRPGCFDPDSTATRAEAATFIHRSFGAPPAPSPDFSDVVATDFFAEAVGWMVAVPHAANSPGPCPPTGQWNPTFGFSLMFRSFFDAGRVANHTAPSENPGATTETCGLPSPLAVPR